jgi:hypothetical protein
MTLIRFWSTTLFQMATVKATDGQEVQEWLSAVTVLCYAIFSTVMHYWK